MSTSPGTACMLARDGATAQRSSAMVGGHRSIDHTADLAFEVWGDSEAAMLVEAARAVVEVLTDGARVASTAVHDVAVEAIDAEDRLVRWLNEVIWLAIGEGFLVADAELELSEHGLRGRVQGEAEATARVVTEIKAATYHDLEIRHAPDRVTARFVLDV